MLSNWLKRLGVTQEQLAASERGLNVYSPPDCPLRCVWCGQLHAGICDAAREERMRELEPFFESPRGA